VKLISRSKALVQLRKIREEFRTHIAADYETRANSCSTCETPGACCLDRHFVNVRISRLEASAIGNVIDGLSPELRERIWTRAGNTIVDGDGRYACPLFEPGVGCTVHDEAKPLPCIAHACYERKEDLPPDELLSDNEDLVNQLDVRTYGSMHAPLAIPVALDQASTRRTLPELTQ
jgi:hypothetical protein